jgi:hypothetical protein
MPITYEPIATTTLTSNAASYDFTSIPATYTDLILVSSAATVAQSNITFRVGNATVDTGSNYSVTWLYGTGSSAASTRSTSLTFGYFDYQSGASTTLGENIAIAQFMNYSNTTTYKTILSRSNLASAGVDAVVNLWRSTVAINIIQVRGATSNLKTGTTLTLYGIKAA